MNLRGPFFMAGATMTALLLLVLGISLTDDQRRGEVKVTPTYPGVVYMGHIGQGRSVEGEFEADLDLNVYLLTDDQVESFINPTYHDDFELPDPVHQGKDGSFHVRMNRSGSYNMLFWNDSVNGIHRVRYEMNTGPRIHQTPFVTSVISLATLSILLLTIHFIKVGKKRSDRPYDVRRR